MYAGCVRCVLNHAVRAVCGVSPVYRTPASRFLKCSERSNITAASWSWSSFSTSADGIKQTPAAPEKKRQVFRAQGKVSSVGRKIAYELIRVISETGEDLGIMHRADVIRLMDRQGLKLVLLDQNKDPPVYQLMSGKQIHQEQLKQREKAKPGVWCSGRDPSYNFNIHIVWELLTICRPDHFYNKVDLNKAQSRI